MYCIKHKDKIESSCSICNQIVEAETEQMRARLEVKSNRAISNDKAYNPKDYADVTESVNKIQALMKELKAIGMKWNKDEMWSKRFGSKR